MNKQYEENLRLKRLEFKLLKEIMKNRPKKNNFPNNVNEIR